jgi:hypothetical protein
LVRDEGCASSRQPGCRVDSRSRPRARWRRGENPAPLLLLNKGTTHASYGLAREGQPWIDGEQATPAQKEITC